MEVRTGRMIHLGYGKYWRSDEIVGVEPIDEDRGPGRRTKVYFRDRVEPTVVSRTERAVVRDMTRSEGEGFRTSEAISLMHDLLDDLGDLSPEIRRTLATEAHFDVEVWVYRLRSLLEGEDHAADQEDLFASGH